MAFETVGQHVYYQLDENNLPFLAEVTAAEVLERYIEMAEQNNLLVDNSL